MSSKPDAYQTNPVRDEAFGCSDQYITDRQKSKTVAKILASG
jgi:hypothetical protein